VLHDDITLLGIDSARPAAAADSRLKSPRFTYRFAAKPQALQGARAAVRGFLANHGIAETVANDIVLALDEACQNVIRHAYRDSGEGEIVIEMEIDGSRLITYVRDFAPEIDDITVAPRIIDDTRPGGLGTHFMREIMDEVAYLRPDDGTGNLLRMCKEILRRQPSRGE
jgi:phosphoserine phosphatase RsbU/P